jgi:hypothetical protein
VAPFLVSDIDGEVESLALLETEFAEMVLLSLTLARSHEYS